MKEKLRIAHYNILYGGEKRIPKITAAIKKINPDICGILEAVNWHKAEKDYKNLGKSMGFSFYKLAKANSKHNIGIFSKIPISVKTIRKNFRHVVLKATIKNHPLSGISVYFIHLSPTSEKDRLSEINMLLEIIGKDQNVIIMGDFNSLSSKDPYDIAKLIKIFKERKIKKYGKNKINFNVINKIEASGFVDSALYLKESFTNSTPTLSNTDPEHATKLRIDYAFVNKKIIDKIKKVNIVKNSTTNKASDHFPLFIDLASWDRIYHRTFP